MSESPAETPAYGAAKSAKPARRPTRVQHLQQMKAAGERWAMLTAYDYSTARLFEEAGIPVLLVGDSAANVVYGYDTTVPITADELIPLVRGVVRGAPGREQARGCGDRPGSPRHRDALLG
ncbi:3-methyl-2-oxobutanoate hydroxymethyltransferase, partial [Nocardia sp. NPDC024068]|uniref:3-methyl-2-oxobutanoate hydroxymethyltransferase n=1 Tax=Nocardia sp. NPDC024068 TaxID=3157197 RepID=UPI0033ECDF8A